MANFGPWPTRRLIQINVFSAWAWLDRGCAVWLRHVKGRTCPLCPLVFKRTGSRTSSFRRNMNRVGECVEMPVL
jgi:hypothetical protein